MSPTPETEDRQNTFYANASNVVSGTDSVPRGEDNGAKRQYTNRREDEEVECGAEAGGEHDADADDEGEESPQRSTEDSENASEAGDFHDEDAKSSSWCSSVTSWCREHRGGSESEEF